MHAWRINELGHPSTALVLEDIADPVPGPDEVLISVEAGNINFADILLCQGIYQDRPGVPFTPGLETCGVIEAVGSAVDDPQLVPGVRVAGMSALPAGGYAEKALLRANTVLVMPADLPAEVATVLYSTYQTSHVGLFHRGGLRAGDWLLVHAAAGGVGSAAAQLGAAVGARVIVTAGSPERVQHAIDDVRQLTGGETAEMHGFDYGARGADGIRDDVMALTDGRGVDVAFDPIGGPVGEITRRLMAWEGRLIVVGFAAGEIPSYPANHLLVKNYSVVGLHWGAYVDHGGRPVIEAAHADLLDRYYAGTIRPPVAEQVPLAELPDALARLEARQVRGRLVVTNAVS